MRTFTSLSFTAVVAAMVALTGCANPTDTEPETVTVTSSINTSSAAPSPTLTDAPPAPTSAPAVDVAAIASTAAETSGARVGVAVDGTAAGELIDGPAWSTIKVPLAIAAQRVDPTVPVDAAITVSDNASAESLWQSLGAGTPAAAAVEEVLAEGGDTSTRVQPEVIRPGFSAFGQTNWALADQSVFAPHIPDLDSTGDVFDAMGRISPGHAYGLGTIPEARFKGGWGPEPDGAYLVRQFGLVPTSCGQHGVAVAAIAHDGTYESAQYALNNLAEQLMIQLEAGCSAEAELPHPGDQPPATSPDKEDESARSLPSSPPFPAGAPNTQSPPE